MNSTRSLLLMLLVGALPQAGAQQVSLKETVETEDFSLAVPEGWERQEAKDTVLTLIAPLPAESGAFRENIRIKKYPLQGNDKFDQILAAQLRTVPEQFTTNGSGILREDEPRIAWLAITKKEAPSGQVLLTKIDYLLVHGGHLYALHCMCEASRLEDRQPVFAAIAQSLSFQKASPAPESITPLPDAQRSEAYEQGGKIGQYTLYAIVIAIAVWGLVRIVGLVRRRRGGATEK